jgi:NAD-dependent DNA ligase
MYAIKADREFHNRFEQIQQQVKEIQHSYFAVANSEMTDLEWDEYNDKANALEDAVIRLLRDADDRITYKEEE